MTTRTKDMVIVFHNDTCAVRHWSASTLSFSKNAGKNRASSKMLPRVTPAVQHGPWFVALVPVGFFRSSNQRTHLNIQPFDQSV